MEALVLSGLAMKLACCSRPASGAEHVVSHFWECYKLARGIWPEYHGKKVGVATVVLFEAYHNLAERLPKIDPTEDKTDWEDVYSQFSEKQLPEVKKLNTPTITDKIDPEKLRKCWPEICRLIKETLPTTEELVSLMNAAGCATTPEEVHVSPELFATGLRYHPYMRYRLLITRLMPMLGKDIMEYID